MRLIETHPIDVVIATHPFAVSLRAARTLSARTRIPWVADMRDGWSTYYFGEYPSGSILQRVLAMIEQSYLASASKVVTINQTLAETLKSDPRKIAVITNSFDPEVELPQGLPRAEGQPFRFGFAGSVHKDHAWDLFFDALMSLPKEQWLGRVVVDYFGDYHFVLDRMRAEAGLPKSLIRNRGYIEQRHLRAELAGADALLVFGFKGAFGDAVTTGKVFDYIETRKPIVVVGPATSELARLVTTTGVGVVLSDVPSVRAVLERVVDDPAALLEAVAPTVDERALAEVSAPEVARRYIQLLSEVSAGL
jgi:glycosyltransferase involved in cell wall biosynthesis